MPECTFCKGGTLLAAPVGRVEFGPVDWGHARPVPCPFCTGSREARLALVPLRKVRQQ